MAETSIDADPRFRFLTQDEARAVFDRNARRYMNMSGDEFLRAWDAGEFDDDLDRPELFHVTILLPLVR